MKKILSFILFILSFGNLIAQPIEVNIFQQSSTATTATYGLRVRATGANVSYLGVTFYMLYQSANASSQSTAFNSVVGVDDSRITTGFGWGTGSRFTNPAQDVGSIDPGAPGGQTYNRRYVYGNSDDAGGANLRVANNQWDTLLYITLNSLQPGYPQAGYVHAQATSDPSAAGAALSDDNFANVPYSSTAGDLPLGNTLPVTFASFNATCSPNGALVKWATAQEANSDYFEVQRSSDGLSWKTIGRTPAAGSSSDRRDYNQIDLEAGNALYRIKQVDKDRRVTYTDIVRTNCEVKNVTTLLYPVPAKDVLNVVIKSDKAVRTQLLVFDITGKLVKRLDANVQNGSNNFRISLTGLSAGDYILKSTDAQIQLNKKFTVVN